MKYYLVMVLLLIGGTKSLLAQTEGNNLYDNSFVHTLEITSSYPGAIIDSLANRHNAERNLSPTNWSYMPVTAKFDGNVVTSVGMRIKGGDISFSTVKPSLKLDLNEFVSGQKYDGLKKINVDNCLYDPSLMREVLYYDLAVNIGLKASRTSFVKVYIDGVSYGNYVYIEQVNKGFLERNFGNKDGNLYKGRGGAGLNAAASTAIQDVTVWPYYELKTNETANDWSGLIQLIDKVHNTPAADFQDTISKYLNVDAVLSYMALGTTIGYSDNLFSGGNNGYWYHNTATGKFEIIPWDIDDSFTAGSTNIPLMNTSFLASTIFGKLLTVPAYETAYLNKCCYIHTHLGHEDSLKAQIDAYKTILQNASITPDANCDYASYDAVWSGIVLYNFLGLKDFIEKRHPNVSAGLATHNINCSVNLSTTEVATIPEFKVYPNPAVEMLSIDFPHDLEKYQLSIVNAIGQTLITLEHASTTIDVRHLNKGVYFLLLDNGKNRFTKPFTKS